MAKEGTKGYIKNKKQKQKQQEQEPAALALGLFSSWNWKNRNASKMCKLEPTALGVPMQSPIKVLSKRKLA